MIESKFIEQIAKEVSAEPAQVSAVIELIDNGSAIPFVKKYRKDLTGNLNEQTLTQILERNQDFKNLTNRREAILVAISKQGMLDDEEKKLIDSCLGPMELEDNLLPFKSRRSRATVAIERGLEPLAKFLLDQKAGDTSLEEYAKTFQKPEKSIATAEDALKGARFILAEGFAYDIKVRRELRRNYIENGVLKVRATKNSDGKKSKFSEFFDHSEKVSKIQAQSFLAIQRGVREGALRMSVENDDEKIVNGLLSRCLKEPGSEFEPHLRLAVEEAYRNHLKPALESDSITWARNRSNREAVRVFCENARNILTSSIAGKIPVIGITIGQKSNLSIAALDGDGSILESVILDIKDIDNLDDSAKSAMKEIIEKHKAFSIVIGSNPGSRKIAKVVNEVLAEFETKQKFCVIISELASNVQSGSRASREEFPNLERGARRAVSLGRRLQDPLLELVKIDPRNIGVGAYHHDVSQKLLRESLARTVVSCVSKVGVDVNTAPASLLRYVAGMQMGTAQNIVVFRTENGKIRSREQLLEIDGIGPKVFEQCAGFMRVYEGDKPLDATAIHPETYPLVDKIAADNNVAVGDLIRKTELINKIEFEKYESESVSKRTLSMVRRELKRPSEDPRPHFKTPRFLEGVNTIDDLKEGVETEGIVTNVTDFGAFVDVGVTQDGLVHLSEIANRFVRDPREAVKVGDVVRVKVIKVDKETPRISLSMKAVAPKRVKKPARQQSARGDHDDSAKPKARTPRRRPDGEGTKARSKTSRPHSKRKSHKPQKHVEESAAFNTLLADQLAALKGKLGS